MATPREIAERTAERARDVARALNAVQTASQVKAALRSAIAAARAGEASARQLSRVIDLFGPSYARDAQIRVFQRHIDGLGRLRGKWAQRTDITPAVGDAWARARAAIARVYVDLAGLDAVRGAAESTTFLGELRSAIAVAAVAAARGAGKAVAAAVEGAGAKTTALVSGAIVLLILLMVRK